MFVRLCERRRDIASATWGEAQGSTVVKVRSTCSWRLMRPVSNCINASLPSRPGYLQPPFIMMVGTCGTKTGRFRPGSTLDGDWFQVVEQANGTSGAKYTS